MSQIWDIYCKHCLWSIFGPSWCTKSCKTTFYAHLSRIWKLARFTRFIQKVFATKILLSGKFSLFVTLILSYISWLVSWKIQMLDFFVSTSTIYANYQDINTLFPFSPLESCLIVDPLKAAVMLRRPVLKKNNSQLERRASKVVRLSASVKCTQQIY